MAGFTYQIPDERVFYQYVLTMLSRSNNSLDARILEVISGGYCSIEASSSFSNRWNAYHAMVYFYVPIDKIAEISTDERRRLIQVCDQIMPRKAGYDITGVDLSPILDAGRNMQNDLEAILESAKIETFNILPDDIRQKGREMSEVYIYLYCVENSLRVFVEEMFCRAYGQDYLPQITIPRDVKKSIDVRKEQENKNQWLGIRGGSFLYYLDFKELSGIIVNNWEIFKGHFPDQPWLNVKIEEMANCRNLIAHNSYVSEREKELLRVNYYQILAQIGRRENANTSKNPTQPTNTTW